MNPANEIWPPSPIRPETDADDDDWLRANDFIREVTWRDYAAVYFTAFWLLLTCFAIVTHHHLPAGAMKSIYHIIRTAAF